MSKNEQKMFSKWKHSDQYWLFYFGFNQMVVIWMRKVTAEDVDRALKESNLMRSDVTSLSI